MTHDEQRIWLIKQRNRGDCKDQAILITGDIGEVLKELKT